MGQEINFPAVHSHGCASMFGLEGKGIPRILNSAASMPAFKWISMEEAMPPSSVRLDICLCSSMGEECYVMPPTWLHKQETFGNPKNNPKQTSIYIYIYMGPEKLG